MITLQNITLKRGSEVLLEQINWIIYHKQRIGLIGHNGSGKSSLFAMLLTNHFLEAGQLLLPKQIKFAHVDQEIAAITYDQTALQFVLSGDIELAQLEQQLQIAIEQNDGMKIAELHEKMNLIDAYTAKARAGQLLAGLGFTHEEQQKTMGSFSGGWRVRLNLARALFISSDVLLLDEPTNHLDLDAILWLESWLEKYSGTLLLISHDRDFLDKSVDHIAYINNKKLIIYTGNYSTFEKQRARELLTQQATIVKQQQKLAHLTAFVNRFRAKASKAKQAQSRLKAIERMDILCAVQTESPFQFEFKKPDNISHPLISLDAVSIGYNNHLVLKKLDFSVGPHDRIAIIGPNGAGKSSFIKLLAGEITPIRGQRIVNKQLKIGYFAQHQVDQLQLQRSPLDHLREIAANHTETTLRTFLGGFDFSGETVLAPVQHFSGGEKSRLALALLIWQCPHLLLLDEPTNHLDLDMRQALSLALQTFEGALLLVTHDRFLIRNTTDKLLLVANQQLQPFAGDLNDYQQWLIQFRKNQPVNSSPPANKKIKIHDKNQLKLLEQKINQQENELTKLQIRLKNLEDKLTEPQFYTHENQEKLKEQLTLQHHLKRQIETLEEDWVLACEKRDQLSQLNKTED